MKGAAEVYEEIVSHDLLSLAGIMCSLCDMGRAAVKHCSVCGDHLCSVCFEVCLNDLNPRY